MQQVGLFCRWGTSAPFARFARLSSLVDAFLIGGRVPLPALAGWEPSHISETCVLPRPSLKPLCSYFACGLSVSRSCSYPCVGWSCRLLRLAPILSAAGSLPRPRRAGGSGRCGVRRSWRGGPPQPACCSGELWYCAALLSRGDGDACMPPMRRGGPALRRTGRIGERKSRASWRPWHRGPHCAMSGPFRCRRRRLPAAAGPG